MGSMNTPRILCRDPRECWGLGRYGATCGSTLLAGQWGQPDMALFSIHQRYHDTNPWGNNPLISTNIRKITSIHSCLLHDNPRCKTPSTDKTPKSQWAYYPIFPDTWRVELRKILRQSHFWWVYLNQAWFGGFSRHVEATNPSLIINLSLVNHVYSQQWNMGVSTNGGTLKWLVYKGKSY